MSNIGRQLCRFCLKIIQDENFQTIGEITLKILDVLSIEMNMGLDGRCLMCRDCEADIERCFNFKAACIYSEDSILEYITEGSKLDLEEIYLKKRSRQRLKRIPKGNKICRLCMKITGTAKCLNNTNDLMASTNDKLQKFIPELNLGAVKNPMICEACLVGLQGYSEFVDGFLDVEKKIDRYCEARGIAKREVQLYNVLQFIMNDVLECNINSYAVSRNRRKLNEDESDIEINCIVPNTVQFDIKEENTEMKVEDNRESFSDKRVNCVREIGLVNESQVHCLGTDLLIVNEDKNGYDLDREKEQDKLFIPSRVKGENVDENESKYSIKHDFLESDTEIYIKDEEMEIKSEDADISDSTHYESHSNSLDKKKSYKKKCDKGRQKRKGAFVCEICSTSYSAKLILARHKFYKHGEGPQPRFYKCEQCTFKSVYKRSLGLHKLVHKNVLETEVYKCPKCSFKTKYKNSLKGHSLLHLRSGNKLNDKSKSKVQMYSCSLCPYKTTHKSHMRDHDLVHKDKSELITYDCFHCPYKTIRKRHLRRHMIIHKTPPEFIKFKCSTCNFHTKYKSSLSKHLLVHGDQPEIYIYRCDKCVFETKCRTTLRKHKLIHMDSSKLKVLKCEICPYQATTKYNFKQHSLTHQKVKQAPLTIHKCTHCSYQSQSKNYLKLHLLGVHKDKSINMPIFKCLRCSYETMIKGALVGHVHTHRNSSVIELYKCQTCGGEYNKRYLTRHQRACIEREDVRPKCYNGEVTNKKM